MNNFILNYTKRYTQPSMTQSYIKRKSMDQYKQSLRYYQYVEIGSKLQRDPNAQLCGVKNIGNTCYFSVLIQLIYHINSVRDYILSENFANQSLKKRKLLEQLKNLFSRMMFSKYSFSDPFNVFEQINNYDNQINKLGDQNDFNQYFVKTLDKLENSLTNSKIETKQRKFISILFQGKMTQNLNDGQTIIKKKNIPFGVINLDSRKGNFQSAIKQFFKYDIQGYKNSKGNIVTATNQIQIQEFPLILTFNLNRVYIKESKYQKLNNSFQYPKNIQALKDKGIFYFNNIGNQLNDLELQINKFKQILIDKKYKVELDHVKQTLKFLQMQEIKTSLQINQFSLKFGTIGMAQNHQDTKNRLRFYINKLQNYESKIIEKIKELQIKKQLLRKKNQIMQYNLFAMIIHNGKADTGHYFLLIYNETQRKWRKYNDKIITQITQKEAQQISLGKINQNMNVCCLFYKQKNLKCDPFSNMKSFQTLRNNVNIYDKQLQQKIDQYQIERMIKGAAQLAHQQTFYTYQKMKNDQHFFINYFIDHTYFLLSQNKQKLAQLLILRNLISQPRFLSDIRKKCPSQSKFILPQIPIQLDMEYVQVINIIKASLDAENVKLGNLNLAINWLVYNRKFAQKKPLMKQNYEKILIVFLFKLCFYINFRIQKGKNCAFQIDHIKLALPYISKQIYKKQIEQNIDYSFPKLDLKLKGIVHQQQPIQNSRPGDKISIGRLFENRFKLWIQFYKKIQKTQTLISQQERIEKEEMLYFSVEKQS